MADPTLAALQRLTRKIRQEAHQRERTALGLNANPANAAWVRHDAAATWMRLAETWVDAENRRAKAQHKTRRAKR